MSNLQEVPSGVPLCPAAVYIGTLSSPVSRSTQQFALETAARTLTNGGCGAVELPWSALRYHHTARLQVMLRERYAPATTNRIMAAVRGALLAAKRLGQISLADYDAAADFKSLKNHRLPAGRSVATAELDALFGACGADRSAAGVRDAAVLAAVVGCGLRRAEAAALDLADIHWDSGEVTVRAGKGDQDRAAFGGTDVMLALRQWVAARGDAPGALFCPVSQTGDITVRRMSAQAVYDLMRKRAGQAGIARFSPHDLRRTFITELLEAGADLVKVQRLVGHASVATTARYDRRGDAELRRAANLLRLPVRLVECSNDAIAMV